MVNSSVLLLGSCRWCFWIGWWMVWVIEIADFLPEFLLPMSLVLWFHVGNNSKLLLCNLSLGGNCRAKRKNDRLNFFTWQVSSGVKLPSLEKFAWGKERQAVKRNSMSLWQIEGGIQHESPKAWSLNDTSRSVAHACCPPCWGKGCSSCFPKS